MYKKEISYYFSTPIAYIVIGLYLLSTSLFLWVIPGEWNIFDSGYAEFGGLFSLSPWLLMFLCSALTMRLFTEERQRDTWSLLLTKPISVSRIVLAKYGAACTLIVISLLPIVMHYMFVYFLAEPVGNVDGGAFAGSMLGLLLLSAAFLAVGLAGSMLAKKSQIVAFILSLTLCFVLYWTLLQDHYASIARGVIDLRDVFIYLLVIILSLNVTLLFARKF